MAQLRLPPFLALIRLTVISHFWFSLQISDCPEPTNGTSGIEQSLGAMQTISASYVGAAGRKLLQRVSMTGSAPNFTDDGTIDLTTSTATSDYHALQMQFERRLYRGLQMLASYTWAHSIDIASSDVATQIPARDTSPELNRGSSDFDVRHSFQAALTFEVPRLPAGRLSAIFGHWALESIFMARSATPVDITIDRSLGIDSVLVATHSAVRE